MSFYTRHQISQLLEVDEDFVAVLEREEIIAVDAPPDAPAKFSERMLERVRVTHNLVNDLDVNYAGASIIVRMREDMSELRQQLEQLVTELRRLKKG